MKAACAASAPSAVAADVTSPVSPNEIPPNEDSTAKAETGPTIRSHSEGLFTSATVGLGYGYGSYESTVLTAPNTSFDGLAVDIAAAVGYGLAPGFVLAFELGIFSHPAFSEKINFNTGAFVTDITTARFGPLADLHPFGGDSPFHLQAGLDLALGFWNGAPGVPPAVPLPIDEVSVGYLAHVAAGWVWRVHSYEIGVSLRGHFGGLGSEHASGSLRGYTALVGFYL
jgi:hypothetical protein